MYYFNPFYNLLLIIYSYHLITYKYTTIKIIFPLCIFIPKLFSGNVLLYLNPVLISFLPPPNFWFM